MEASSLSSQLRHRLRATVCACFGQQGGAGERTRWSRRAAGAGEFRYDPLSYALNFDDQGADDDDVEDEDEGEEGVYAAGRGGGLLYHHPSFSSRLPTPSPAFEVA